MNRKLEARVAAQNAANHAANRLSDILQEHFAPFVGQKVVNRDKTLSMKVMENFPTILVDKLPHVVHCYRDRQDLDLVWKVKTSVDTQHFTAHQEATAWVGYIGTGGVLSHLSCVSRHREDWTVQEVLDYRARIDQTKRDLYKMNRHIEEFGEVDY